MIEETQSVFRMNEVDAIFFQGYLHPGSPAVYLLRGHLGHAGQRAAARPELGPGLRAPVPRADPPPQPPQPPLPPPPPRRPRLRQHQPLPDWTQHLLLVQLLR